MYLLYERFVEQAKQADIQRYNAKHRDYLIRAGKINADLLHQDKSQQQNQGLPPHYRQREFRKQNVYNRNRDQSNFSQKRQIVDKPIRGSQGYNLDLTDQAEIFAKSKKQQTEVIHLNQLLKEAKKEQISLKQRNSQPQSIVEKRSYESIKPEKIQQKIVEEAREEQLQEHAEVQLIQCPQNCGRKFNPRALQKHVKICQKGEKKRKVFKVKVVDEEAQKLKRDEPIAEAVKKDDVPKWKKQSQELRNRIQNKQVVDDRTECPGCGRKFEENAASRHIPKCVQRATINRKK